MDISSHAIADFDQHLARFEGNSDVVVKCGGRKWNLHKVVLATRCLWFHLALTHDSHDGQPDEISILEQDEYMIDYLIEYIYTGDFDWRKIQGGLTLTETYMDAFDLADHFLLPDLRKRSKDAFTEMLLDAVLEFQVSRQVGGIDTVKLVEIVRDVYTRENSVAVATFKRIVGIAIYSALPRLESIKLVDLINEIPAVVGDIWAYSLSRHQVAGGHPNYCVICGTPCTDDLGFSGILPSGGPMYFCQFCRPDHMNNQDDGRFHW